MTLDDFITGLGRTIINPTIFLMFGVALLVFLWGVFKYVRNAESGDKGEYKNALLWGLVGMFVMIGVYGIWGVVLDTFGVSKNPIETLQRR